MTSSSGEIEFRDIDGFPGYRVGSDGSVWSCRSINGRGTLRLEWRMLKPNYVGRVKGRPRSGYLAVLLMRDRTRYGRRVHLLVLTAFRGPCPAGMEGCHEDGDTSNNNLFNLRWGTRLSNHADKERHGTKLIGVKNPRAKLDDDRVRTIRARHLLGETKRSLAREYGVSPPVIGDIVSRKKWKHVGD